eukprot:CAMPEP_0172473104 /NCGR_PEP_ID=MMETSP1065-20121228/68684_1 /TAXON_ID=265537 /ORGANISM="Amphiprora paludosa, Strain CCMP125" /LENGTH=174 /DNA_ID=CAMNT_0013231273 /DNA_START=368 /DNA_END=892 /DNA_ORIENTATION=-
MAFVFLPNSSLIRNGSKDLLKIGHGSGRIDLDLAFQVGTINNAGGLQGDRLNQNGRIRRRSKGKGMSDKGSFKFGGRIPTPHKILRKSIQSQMKFEFFLTRRRRRSGGIIVVVSNVIAMQGTIGHVAKANIQGIAGTMNGGRGALKVGIACLFDQGFRILRGTIEVGNVLSHGN